MRKAAGWKKAMASLVSAATLFSCTITGTMNFSQLLQADGANYAEPWQCHCIFLTLMSAVQR